MMQSSMREQESHEGSAPCDVETDAAVIVNVNAAAGPQIPDIHIERTVTSDKSIYLIKALAIIVIKLYLLWVRFTEKDFPWIRKLVSTMTSILRASVRWKNFLLLVFLSWESLPTGVFGEGVKVAYISGHPVCNNSVGLAFCLQFVNETLSPTPPLQPLPDGEDLVGKITLRIFVTSAMLIICLKTLAMLMRLRPVVRERP